MTTTATPIQRLATTRKGTGEPLLLLHGIGHRRQAWDPVLARLAESYDVIAADLPGFGESDPFPPGSTIDMDAACRAVVAELERLGISKPHVMGNSLGGAMALELAQRGHAASVVALSPAGFFRHLGDRLQALGVLAVLKGTASAPAAVLRRVTATRLGRRLAGMALFTHTERLDADGMYGDSLALRDGSAFWPIARSGATYNFHGTVDVPVTVAWGTRDRILRHGQSSRARRQLADARHVDLLGAGHVPMIDEPDTIVRLVQETTARA
ncbi:alpha/beta fold hydrolase [Aeromicrobium massiliense]|uniref:alpha/beta fold hydrolase n=1 Tax=Aeromicrobium massiliense TaxID=1464554 RepID=UPI0002F13075|nr:alpha/beta hydrolase [Aeromicrobium massiliense]